MEGLELTHGALAFLDERHGRNWRFAQVNTAVDPKARGFLAKELGEGNRLAAE